VSFEAYRAGERIRTMALPDGTPDSFFGEVALSTILDERYGLSFNSHRLERTPKPLRLLFNKHQTKAAALGKM
jgi:hypothetical protein